MSMAMAYRFFTSDGNTAREFSRRVQVNMVGVNIADSSANGGASFGGWKRSLFGDVHAYGERESVSTRVINR